MDHDEHPSMIRLVFFICAVGASAACAAATDDVQRQLLQREQSQTELRLRMQQQRERAAQPPQTPREDVQRRMLEAEQQQRLGELQERQAREGIAPAPPGDMHREIERERLPQASSEELKRYERERQVEIQRAREADAASSKP